MIAGHLAGVDENDYRGPHRQQDVGDRIGRRCSNQTSTVSPLSGFSAGRGNEKGVAAGRPVDLDQMSCGSERRGGRGASCAAAAAVTSSPTGKSVLIYGNGVK